ncbi:MAG: putative phage abortive infection protein [Bacteroidota bacterium]
MKIIKKYWALILIIIAYLILLFLYFSHFGFKYSKTNGDWGTFGDFLGGSLSPLIGIITIILTYNIINNQSQENKQSEFKNIFQILFDSINDKKEIIERKGKPNLSGSKAVARINRDIEAVFKYKKKKNPNSDKLELFTQSFWSVYDDINGSSSPYMKVLHNCLKAIDKHCIEERQEAYSSLLRAQLHPDELVFIFYNAIASDDFKNFKLRLEKYSIMKDIANYGFPQELKEKYNPNAFKEDEIETKKITHYNRVFSFEIKFTFNKK